MIVKVKKNKIILEVSEDEFEAIENLIAKHSTDATLEHGLTAEQDQTLWHVWKEMRDVL